MTATITPIRRPRAATPARWQAALRRALENGVKVYQISGTGESIATSQREPGTAYRTDGASCECAAALLGGDPVCAHRAAYWHRAGVLDLDPEPEPMAPAVDPLADEAITAAHD